MTRPTLPDPDLCIIHTGEGGRVPPELAALLDPVDPGTLHTYVLPANTEVELHGHDIDEYWWFVEGHPRVTLWTPATGTRDYALGPGDLVALVRGMAHTLRADHPLVYHQFESLPAEGVRRGHLTPEELTL
jgi:mannose-6-phosphate isomerase-like protein (cupin superfamily)